MEVEFNLLKRPWIECVTEGGLHALNLRDTIAHAHSTHDISGETPLVKAALLRLLLAVCHRVYGPADEDAWLELWERGAFDPQPLDAYLAQWQHRFDLFDQERPFYQMADDRVKPKPINSLLPHLAFGNKATLFDHNSDDEAISILAPEAARALVTAQAFGLAGLSGLKDKFTDGACTRGVIYFIKGKTLFETLMLNLIQYPTADEVFQHNADDKSSWEMDDPFTPNRTIPRGYLDYLTWQNRRVMLLPEEQNGEFIIREMTVAPGLRLDAAVLDTMKHYARRTDKDDLKVQRFVEDRALWRDCSALFQRFDTMYHPPRALSWIANVVDVCDLDTDLNDTQLAAMGMANNQAKIDFYRSELTPLPTAYLIEKPLVGKLSEMLGFAEAVRSRLWSAARTLAEFILNPEADASEAHQPNSDDVSHLTDQWAMEREYWQALEPEFHKMMVDLAEAIDEDTRDGVIQTWMETLRATAWHAFERIARDLEHDPHKLKATVRGRSRLAYGLAEALKPA